MQLHPDIKSILLDIDFLNRYRALSQKYPYADESLEKYSNEEIQKIFTNLGYNAKFFKKENFFGIKETIAQFQFQFNMSFKYGIVEFIWGLTSNGERLTLGGPWGLIGDLLLGVTCEIKKPAFRNYQDLTEILKTGLILYNDFKEAVIKSDIHKLHI